MIFNIWNIINVIFSYFPVYLKADPQRVYERIKKRARSEEQCVPLSYIEELHKLHEDWLIHRVHGECPAPVSSFTKLVEEKRWVFLFIAVFFLLPNKVEKLFCSKNLCEKLVISN